MNPCVRGEVWAQTWAQFPEALLLWDCLQETELCLLPHAWYPGGLGVFCRQGWEPRSKAPRDFARSPSVPGCLPTFKYLSSPANPAASTLLGIKDKTEQCPPSLTKMINKGKPYLPYRCGYFASPALNRKSFWHLLSWDLKLSHLISLILIHHHKHFIPLATANMCFGPCENSEHPTGYLVTSNKEPAAEVTSVQISQNDRKAKKGGHGDGETGGGRHRILCSEFGHFTTETKY